MKPVTKYEADDGSVHDSAKAATERDELIRRCEAIQEELGMRPRPEGASFGSGRGYVQHPAGTRKKLLEWLKMMGANRESAGPTGRLIHRMWCIDEDDREWGQPYFALNPGEGEEVAL